MAASLPVMIIAAPTDVDFARKLQTDLGIRGVPAAVESSDSHLSPPHFAEAIAHLLEQASLCLVLLSPAAVSSELVTQVQRAVAAPMERDANARLLLVTLVPAGSISLPLPLARFPLLDLTRLPYEAMLGHIQSLMGVTRTTGASAPRAPEAPQLEEERGETAAPAPIAPDQTPPAGIITRGWGAAPPEIEEETEASAPGGPPAPAAPEPPPPPATQAGVLPPPPPPGAPPVPPYAPAPPAPGAYPGSSYGPPPPAPAAPSPYAPYAPPDPYGAPPYGPPASPPPPLYPPPGALPPGPSPEGSSGSGGGWGEWGGAQQPQPKREKSAPPPARELPLEQATFTAYHPKEMPPRVWQPLLVYISLDTPAALAQVSAAANERLAGRRDQFRAASGEATGLRRGSKLTIVPEIPGFRANPPEMTVAWEEDTQQHEFRLRAETARPGQAANGSVKIYMGPILRGEIPVSIFVQPSGVAGVAADLPANFASVVARAYRHVFASYSHKDTPIVRCCETAAQTMGDRYLRDVTLLRSGEHWDERLLDAVTEADIFQLFWSEHAAKSPAVEKEWRRALSLVPLRGQFIRPVYWSREPYALPPELAAIHFEKLDLARLGWGPARAFLYTTLGIG